CAAWWPSGVAASKPAPTPRMLTPREATARSDVPPGHPYPTVGHVRRCGRRMLWRRVREGHMRGPVARLGTRSPRRARRPESARRGLPGLTETPVARGSHRDRRPAQPCLPVAGAVLRGPATGYGGDRGARRSAVVTG